jgi:hypothetical protein
MPRSLFPAAALAIVLASTAQAEQIILCGWDTVFIVDASRTSTDTEPIWTWDAKRCEQIPESLRRTFATTDECKPADGGSKILISSSSGGCALVERPSGKAIWYAQVPNAHSLELLPRDRIIVASSVHAQGNRLVLFDLDHSDQPIWSTPLVSAHGVVWDEGRQLLWALGLKELQSYGLQDWESEKPALTIKDSYSLPDGGGHDLQPVPGSNDLVVTTGRHVYFFDRDKHEFLLHPDLGDRANVKSVNVHPATGQTAFAQATESWWSDTVGLLSPAGTMRLPGERLYKARWLLQAGSR